MNILEPINKNDIPDFLLKSTLGCALGALILLTPFGINNFIQERYLLGVFTFTIIVLSTIDAWLCYRGRYYEPINLFGIAPAIIIVIMFAMNELGVIASYWASLGVLVFYLTLPEKKALVVNVIFMVIIIPISWNVLEQPVEMRFIAALLGTSFFAYLSMHEISKQHKMLKKQAVTDPLTGLYNRSLLQNSLEYAISQSNRTNIPMTLIMIDLDHFKKVNDELGHDIGDSVLISLGEFLIKFFRESDMVFRLGGEEFLILMHNSDETTTYDVAERMRKEIEQLPLVPNRIITASIGVSTLTSDTSLEEWMKRCDENLYHAKSHGRNNVV